MGMLVLPQDRLSTANVGRFNEMQYADGVFIAMTGGRVNDFEPLDKRNGFRDALNGSISKDEEAFWYDYCVTVMGYVDPLARHWSDDPKHQGGTIL